MATTGRARGPGRIALALSYNERGAAALTSAATAAFAKCNIPFHHKRVLIEKTAFHNAVVPACPVVQEPDSTHSTHIAIPCAADDRLANYVHPIE
jgi:hypothetical protein